VLAALSKHDDAPSTTGPRPGVFTCNRLIRLGKLGCMKLIARVALVLVFGIICLTLTWSVVTAIGDLFNGGFRRFGPLFTFGNLGRFVLIWPLSFVYLIPWFGLIAGLNSDSDSDDSVLGDFIAWFMFPVSIFLSIYTLFFYWR
jgi:hypothetical protein